MIPVSRRLASWQAQGRPFAHLPPLAAALILALLAAAMAWSIYVSLPTAQTFAQTAARPSATTQTAEASGARVKGDMALYARIAARVDAGEGYYAAALGEHRASGYPTRPFVTVRLPTLAMVQGAIGPDAVRWLALVLTGAGILALNWRSHAFGSTEERIIASALVAAGGGAAFSPVAGYDHDFIAGLLLTLALLAYRRARWWPALIAAAAALAVRELAAPFVALWLVFALAERRRSEALAVAAVLAVFAAGMGLHFAAVDAARQSGDLISQGWNARAGLLVPLTGLSTLTGLRHLPPVLAAPLAVLPLLGWAGLGGRTGLFAALWFAGLFAMMALFARPANYYWIELALPAYAIGLAFAPRALRDLIARAARQT